VGVHPSRGTTVVGELQLRRGAHAEGLVDDFRGVGVTGDRAARGALGGLQAALRTVAAQVTVRAELPAANLEIFISVQPGDAGIRASVVVLDTLAERVDAVHHVTSKAVHVFAVTEVLHVVASFEETGEEFVMVALHDYDLGILRSMFQEQGQLIATLSDFLFEVRVCILTSLGEEFLSLVVVDTATVEQVVDDQLAGAELLDELIRGGANFVIHRTRVPVTQNEGFRTFRRDRL